MTCPVNFRPRKIGPLLIKQARLTTAVININGIAETVSLFWVSVATRSNKMTK